MMDNNNNALKRNIACLGALLMLDMMDDDDGYKIDHRTQPRAARRKFDHDAAHKSIVRHYLCSDPLFGAEFRLMFRISRGRFEHMLHSVANLNDKFFKPTTPKSLRMSASMEARLLLPLKTLAFGVADYCFCDYFEMSPELARQCCLEFDRVIHTVYKPKYLKMPTARDVKQIVKLHKAVHGIDGMFGSLDCTHTWWKNCPVEWQGSYKGKEKRPTIVLEGVCDYNLYFWHVSYGYAGTMNDKMIFECSPLMEQMLNGSFDAVEKEAGVVPYTIGDSDPFHLTYILVDGIYQSYSRFVKSVAEPITKPEKKLAQWQESARKDIERAIGVEKGTWKFTENPMHQRNLDELGCRVITCCILHNILMADRIMNDDCQAEYDPAFQLLDQPPVPQRFEDENDGIIAQNTEEAVHALVTRSERYDALTDRTEHERLHIAIMTFVDEVL